MSVPDSNDSYSPFSTEGLTARKIKAFKVVAFLAAVSFLCLLFALYLRFFKTQPVQAVYSLTPQTPELQTEALLNPQPPTPKFQEIIEPPPEKADLHLIRRLEKERTTVEQTAEALRKIVQSTSADTTEKPESSVAPEPAAIPQKASAPVQSEPAIIPQEVPAPVQSEPAVTQQEVPAPVPEKPELQRLQQEKDMTDQAKIEKINALQKERDALEKQKNVETEEILKAEQEKVRVEAEPEKQKTEKNAKKNVTEQKEEAAPEGPKKVSVKAPGLSSPFLSATQTDLPEPDLIKTNLMASLPNFSLLKKNTTQNAIPLHIIDPLPELQEETRYGKMPVKSKGKTPLSAYARPVENPPKTPYIAILFSGAGKRENATQAAISALPETVSLSFSPYAKKLKTFIGNARRAGHETLLDLPMQRGAFPETDPGPLGLVSGLPEQENRKRFHKVLAQEVAFIGLTAEPNETFSYSGSQMKPFFDETMERGLIYISGTDNPRMPLFKNALRPDVHIADEFHRAAIRARLDRARRIALQNGKAFVRVETVPITLLTVAEWIKSFEPTEKNPTPEIAFVPLSYYVLSEKEKK